MRRCAVLRVCVQIRARAELIRLKIERERRPCTHAHGRTRDVEDRSPDEAAEYAAALAKTAAKAKPASGAVRKGLEHGPAVTRWCVQFIRGLRLLLEARMAAGNSDQALPWGKAMQVVVSA